MFRLTKWYLDIVTDKGEAVIAYAARLTIARVSVHYASVLASRPQRADHVETSLRGFEWPALAGDACSWKHDALEFAGHWHDASPAFSRTLLDGPSGHIVWECHRPRARATVRIKEREFVGSGYVECLTISVPPWKLPFHTLRWGRHISPTHSLVWIAWADGLARRWTWLDGEEQPHAHVVGTGLAGLAGNRELQWRESRDVRNRNVLLGLTRVPRAARRQLSDSLSGMHEHKQVSRSSLMASGVALDDGWSIHEVVTW